MKRFLIRGLMGLCLVGVLAGTTGCYSTPEGGQIGVVRNGGSFDNKKIRQVVPNGSGNTWVGWGSDTHYYPVDSQQRYIKAESCYGQADDKCTADRGPWTFQTKDGVDLGVEGTIYLNTTFNDSKEGIDAVKAFDTQFATRTFNGDHAYDGNDGWSNFLGAIVDPVASNNLRDVGSGLECAQFVSSCSLVQNQGSKVKVVVKDKNNQSNIAFVQDAVAAGLDKDLVATLGGTTKARFFKNIKFVITRVDLPGKIQDAINDAQAQFAQVSKINAQVEQEKANVDVQHQKFLARKEQEKGYRACASCARQDEYKALPQGLQTYAPGGNFAVGASGR